MAEPYNKVKLNQTFELEFVVMSRRVKPDMSAYRSFGQQKTARRRLGGVE